MHSPHWKSIFIFSSNFRIFVLLVALKLGLAPTFSIKFILSQWLTYNKSLLMFPSSSFYFFTQNKHSSSGRRNTRSNTRKISSDGQHWEYISIQIYLDYLLFLLPWALFSNIKLDMALLEVHDSFSSFLHLLLRFFIFYFLFFHIFSPRPQE